jgi:hypothetical protein
MGINTSLAAKGERSAELPTLVPVPAPPKSRLAKPRAVQQTPLSRGREHEVQRLIRDLAALAAKRRPSVS